MKKFCYIVFHTEKLNELNDAMLNYCVSGNFLLSATVLCTLPSAFSKNDHFGTNIPLIYNIFIA